MDILMCKPSYYTVAYSINPWMNDAGGGKPNLDLAMQQWEKLHAAIANIAGVRLVEPHSEVPDMVFTANAGLIYENHVVVSRFRFPERQPEEQYFEDWFRDKGFDVTLLPDECYFEGEGDARFDRVEHVLWAGYGFRTSLETHEFLKDLLQIDVISLHLIDPRFYHLDTCFAPLVNGYVVYYPPAFDHASLETIEVRIPAEKRIAISEGDATSFACNIVNVDTTLILNKASAHLKQILSDRGFTVLETPLNEFIKAGGSAKCLTLNLSDHHC